MGKEVKKTEVVEKTEGKSKKGKASEKTEPVIQEVKEVKEVQEVKTEPESTETMVVKSYDTHDMVTVRNGAQGKLVYKSKKTGEKFVWDEFGAEQEMELSELKNVKSANKQYFVKNWFLFDDPGIVQYLGMGQYYKFALKLEEFDQFFQMSTEEIEEAVGKLSEGQKKSLTYCARQQVSEGKIDSRRTIAMLEQCLGVELVEHS